MLLEGLEQLAGHVLAVVGDPDVPGLVVDPGADGVDLIIGETKHLRNLVMAGLDAVTEADEVHAMAGHVACPCVHRHRVGVVDEPAPGRGDLTDVLAAVEQHRDGALRVHDASGAEGIAHALIDTILEGDVDVGGERLETAHPHEGEHVVGAGERLAAVGRRRDGGRHAVVGDVAGAELLGDREIALVDIHERQVCVLQLGHAEDVADNMTGEGDAAGSENGDLYRHGNPSRYGLSRWDSVRRAGVADLGGGSGHLRTRALSSPCARVSPVRSCAPWAE